jgi:hypothetical protein
MESSFGSALEASTASASSIQIYVAELANQSGQAALIAAVALLLIMVLVQVFKPAGSEETVYPDRSPAMALLSPTDDGRQRILVPAGQHAAQAASNAPLAGSGLSATDVVALAALRQRIRTGQVAEGPTGSERLGFARWLIEHGKLDG